MTSILVLLLTVGTVACLAVWIYHFFVEFEVQEPDMNILRRKNLYAMHVHRILESWDYCFYSERDRRYREYLFSSFARNLKQDVADVSESAGGVKAGLYIALFQVCYLALSLKNKLLSGENDLRLLLGIQLMVVRALTH